MHTYIVYRMGRRIEGGIRHQEQACALADEVGGYVTYIVPADTWCGYHETGVYTTIREQQDNPV